MDLSRSIPALRWLSTYDRSWLRGDLVAGITLAAYLLPAALGDASLAQLRPKVGLYACLFSGLVFWLFCSSRHTVITVTSAISLLVGASLAEITGGDTTRLGALAAGTAVLVAVIALIAWAVRAGAIVNFISESDMELGPCRVVGVGVFAIKGETRGGGEFQPDLGVEPCHSRAKRTPTTRRHFPLLTQSGHFERKVGRVR
jgi:hypothetical protein